jgi:hypothetical protein
VPLARTTIVLLPPLDEDELELLELEELLLEDEPELLELEELLLEDELELLELEELLLDELEPLEPTQLGAIKLPS